MPFEFANVFVFLLLAAGFLFATLTIGRLLRPSTPDRAKGMVYECGESPVGGGWFNFNPHFCLIAILFLIFDVEVAITFPVSVAFRRFVALGEGGLALGEIGAFVLVLVLGLAYVWRRRDLEWTRSASAPER